MLNLALRHHIRFFAKSQFALASPTKVDKKHALENFQGPVLAIVGRPNVGKSSIFNRLAGKEVAIVHQTAGITRDRKVGQGSLSDLKFIMIDTPGFEKITRADNANSKKLREAMVQQAENALKAASGAIFVVDASEGLNSDDYAFAKWILARSKNAFPLVLVANKAETKDKNNFMNDVYALKMGEPVFISAKHNVGMADLYIELKDLIEKINQINSNDPRPDSKNSQTEDLQKNPLFFDSKNDILRFSIIGRPNVGKSTLMNSIIKKYTNETNDRVVTSAEPNTTRDSIAVNLKIGGTNVKLIDTAGIIGPNRMSWRFLEREKALAMDDTMRSVAFSNIVTLLIDVPDPKAFMKSDTKTEKSFAEHLKRFSESALSLKDVSIAQKVLEEGRALVVVLNKTDILAKLAEKYPGNISYQDFCAKITENISKKISGFVREGGAFDVIGISALNGDNIELLMNKVLAVYKKWSTRFSTSLINKWLLQIFKFQPPPKNDGVQVKIKFLTQVKARPPTFVLFTNKEVPQNYQKFLSTKIMEEFDLDGVPVRLLFKIKTNPFIKQGERRRKNNKDRGRTKTKERGKGKGGEMGKNVKAGGAKPIL